MVRIYSWKREWHLKQCLGVEKWAFSMNWRGPNEQNLGLVLEQRARMASQWSQIVKTCESQTNKFELHPGKK